jgi:hypothetical protein
MNKVLEARLAGIRDSLIALHGGGSQMSASSRGVERELSARDVLSTFISPSFRFDSGDIIDIDGNQTGQLDCVVEYPGSISFPMRERMPRLYLAEGVVCVVEVKSNLASQWGEVEKSHAKIAPLKRNIGWVLKAGRVPEYVPHFVVGYTGWAKVETMKEHAAAARVDGVYSIEQSLYVSTSWVMDGPAALYGLILDIESLTSSVIGAKPRYADYVTGKKDAGAGVSVAPTKSA